MGPFSIIVAPPFFNLLLSILKGQEPVLVQAFGPESGVDCLEKCQTIQLLIIPFFPQASGIRCWQSETNARNLRIRGSELSVTHTSRAPQPRLW